MTGGQTARVAPMPSGETPLAYSRADLSPGISTVTTDATGYAVFTHGLGWQPAAMVGTVNTPNANNTYPIPCMLHFDQLTAATARVRVWSIGNGSANNVYVGAVNIFWIAAQL